MSTKCKFCHKDMIPIHYDITYPNDNNMDVCVSKEFYCIRCGIFESKHTHYKKVKEEIKYDRA